MITSGHLTKQAKQYALETRIKVIEREELFDLLGETVMNNDYLKALKYIRSINLQEITIQKLRELLNFYKKELGYIIGLIKAR